MSEMLTAHAAKHEFFRDTKARYPHTSNERDGVIGATDEQIQNKKNRLCGQSQKNIVTNNALTAAANATAPRSPILFFSSCTCVSVALALWLLLPSAECPARKAGLSEKSCMLTERFNSGSLPWSWMKPGTLDARHLMSQDLCQPMSCGVFPAKMCRTAPRRFLSMSQAALAQQWRPRASVQRKMYKHREQIKWS